MKSRQYWKDRKLARERAMYRDTDKAIKTIEATFEEAQRKMERDLAYWYARFAVNNDVSYATALKMLNAGELEEFKWTVEEYIRRGEALDLPPEWMKQLENASARVHISRLDALKVQLQEYAEELTARLQGQMTDHLSGVIEDAYYGTLEDAVNAVEMAGTFEVLDEKTLNTLLTKPWAADGKVFSGRLWGNRDKLVRELHQVITSGTIRGESLQKMTKNLAKRMSVAEHQAATLIATETAALSSETDRTVYRELGVEEFEVLETLDTHTCDWCSEMDGRHFPMTQYEVGVTVGPFHPNCRGTSVPYLDDEFEKAFDEKYGRAARDDDGDTIRITPGMEYGAWKTEQGGGVKTFRETV